MDEYGIKITQAGFDVRYAADYQLLFNSSWPSLQCAFDTTVTIAANTNLTITHGLSFVPLTLAWSLQNGTSLGRIFAPSGNFEDPDLINVGIIFDKKNVYLSSTASSAMTINVKCYNVDITRAVDYTLPQAAVVKGTYDPNFGMKVVKYGKSIGSPDLRDFILHTQAQSPALLSVVTEKSTKLAGATAGVIAYLNPAHYVPWTLAFYSSDGVTYQGLAPGSQQTGAIFKLVKDINGYYGLTVTGPGAVLNINTLGTGAKGTIVAIRDPLVVSDKLQVTY